MEKNLLSMLSVLVLIFSLTIFSCSTNKEDLVFLGREEITGKVSHITYVGLGETVIYIQNATSTTKIHCSNKFGGRYEVGDDIAVFVLKYKETTK